MMFLEHCVAPERYIAYRALVSLPLQTGPPEDVSTTDRIVDGYVGE